MQPRSRFTLNEQSGHCCCVRSRTSSKLGGNGRRASSFTRDPRYQAHESLQPAVRPLLPVERVRIPPRHESE